MPRYEVTLRFSDGPHVAVEADDADAAADEACATAHIEAGSVVEVDAYEGEPRGTD